MALKPKIEPMPAAAPMGEHFELAKKWHANSSRTLDDFLGSRAGHASMIFRDWGDGDTRVFYVSRGHLSHFLYGDQFRLKSIGSKGVPDRTFALECNKSYAEASWLQKPTHDSVRGRCGPYWVEYTRLCVPLEHGFVASILDVERILRDLSEPC